MAGLTSLPPVLVLLMVLAGTASSRIAAGAPANPDDAAAMRALANTTGAAKSLGWGVKSGDPCDGTWAGVHCNEEGRVTSISASRGGLVGFVRGADLSKLSFLADLDLSFNYLVDLLPLLPTPLQYLRTLDLRSNQFVDIPEGFFAAFPSLDTINLDDNPMVQGRFFFDVLTSCSSLRSLSANNISIGGNFPNNFGNAQLFPVLETLLLARNNMRGSISASFGNNSKIKYLDISGQFDASDGSRTLTNTIYEFIPGMKSLVEVRMDHNEMYGPLPDATNLVNLRVFSAADNGLCGMPMFSSSIASVNVSGNPQVGKQCYQSLN